MSEWFWYRFVIPGLPVFLQWLAYLSKERPYPFPPLTFSILACIFPSVTAKDYYKRHLLAACIIPSACSGALLVLAVQRTLDCPTSTSLFHWLGFVLWVTLLVVNLLRKAEVF